MQTTHKLNAKIESFRTRISSERRADVRQENPSDFQDFEINTTVIIRTYVRTLYTEDLNF